MAFSFNFQPQQINWGLPSRIVEDTQKIRQAQEAEIRIRQAQEDWRIQQAKKRAYSMTLDERGNLVDTRPYVAAVKGEELGIEAMAALRGDEAARLAASGEAAAQGLNATLMGLDREKIAPNVGTGTSEAYHGAKPPQMQGAPDDMATATEAAGKILPGTPGYGAWKRQGQWAGQLPENPTEEQVSDYIRGSLYSQVQSVPNQPLGILDVKDPGKGLNAYLQAQAARKASVSGKMQENVGTPGVFKEDLATTGTMDAQARAVKADKAVALERKQRTDGINAITRGYNEGGRRFLIDGKFKILDPRKFLPTPEGSRQAFELVRKIESYHATEDMLDGYHSGMTAQEKAAFSEGIINNIINSEGLQDVGEIRASMGRIASNWDDTEMQAIKAAENSDHLRSVAAGIMAKRLATKDGEKQMLDALRYSLKQNTKLKSEVLAYSLPDGEEPRYHVYVGAAPTQQSAAQVAKSTKKATVAGEIKARDERRKREAEPGGSAKTAIKVKTPADALALPPGTWAVRPDGKKFRTKGGAK